jgi:hypothetical protein
MDSYEKEVKSLLNNRNATRPVIMVTYSLENLDQTQKTQFGYALRGRNGKKGLISRLRGEAVGRSNLLVPMRSQKRIDEFLSEWNVRYKVRRLIELVE